MDINTTPPPPDVDRRAATVTMRHDRRFLWLWLAIATFLSVAGNVGHAWLVATQNGALGTPFWMALGWAAAPPVLLMLSVHGLPTLSRMMGEHGNDRLLGLVVWGVTAGAFGWSAVGIYEFTLAQGVPPQLAWLAPLTIDLSVFGATRGLVKTAPIAARMKLGAAPVERPEQHEPLLHDAAAVHAEAADDAPVAQPVEQTPPPHESLRDALQEQRVEPREAARGVPLEQTVTHELAHREPLKVQPEPTAAVSKRAVAEPFTLTVDADELAARIAAETAISLPTRTVVAVLKRAAAGESQRKIASALKGVSPTTAGRVIAAAKELQQERELVTANAA